MSINNALYNDELTEINNGVMRKAMKVSKAPKMTLVSDRDTFRHLERVVNNDVFISFDNALNLIQDSFPRVNIRTSIMKYIDSVMRQCKIDRKAVEAWNKSTFKRDHHKEVPEERIQRATKTMVETAAKLKSDAKEFANNVWDQICKQDILSPRDAINRIIDIKVLPGDPKEISELVVKISHERNRSFRAEVRKTLRELAKNDGDLSVNQEN